MRQVIIKERAIPPLQRGWVIVTLAVLSWGLFIVLFLVAKAYLFSSRLGE